MLAVWWARTFIRESAGWDFVTSKSDYPTTRKIFWHVFWHVFLYHFEWKVPSGTSDIIYAGDYVLQARYLFHENLTAWRMLQTIKVPSNVPQMVAENSTRISFSLAAQRLPARAAPSALRHYI